MTILLHDSPRRPQRSEHADGHYCLMGTAVSWYDGGPRDANHGYWANTVSPPTHAPCSHLALQVTLPLPVEKYRTSRLAAKSMTGLHTLFATIRGRSDNPPSRPPNHPRPHSSSSIANIFSLHAGGPAPGAVTAPRRRSNCTPDVRPDLSALVPDYLDDPPPYSSPIRERQEVIDWQAYFDRTPIQTRTVSPHSSPAIQDVTSPTTSSGAAWDRVARRLSE
jgi:hypothetical protein